MKTLTQEHKNKLSIAHKGKILSEKHKQNIKKGMLNYFDNKGRKGTISKSGYRIITIDNKSVYEHRWIWEQHKGTIPKGYQIHHINGNKLDNRIENLEMLSNSQHQKIHSKNNNFGFSRIGIEPVNKTSDIIRKQIKDLKNKGMFLREICNIVGLSYPTVQKYVKEANNGSSKN